MQRNGNILLTLALVRKAIFNMILKYRVSLPGIKGFARVYELKSTTTLYEFHKRMRADMEFSHDQLIQFK